MQETSRNRSATRQELPGIARIVLLQIARFRSIGVLDLRTFEAQLERLTREELSPRGFALRTDESPEEGTRFIVQRVRTGEVCETIGYARFGS